MNLSSFFDGHLPPAMSAAAPEVDRLYDSLVAFSVVATVLVAGFIGYAVATKRRKPGDRPTPPTGSLATQVLGILVPLGVGFFAFQSGVKAYVKGAVSGDGAIEIRASSQDGWVFEYPGGKKETGKLVVPAGVPVNLVVSSESSVRSLYIPEFRVQKDAVPGMLATISFQPSQEGQAHIVCAGFCGASPAVADVQVVSPKDYQDHIVGGIEGCPKDFPKSPCDAEIVAKAGAALFEKNGCASCHSRDGSTSPGPTFKAVFGRKETMTSGETIDISEDYLRESIRKPQAKIVNGFTTVQMPAFTVNDAELEALVAYLKTVK
jgi:cytochrome c oxidase subunit II